MSQVIYSNDTRYPGPPIHPPPREITGLPTNEELDAYPRMFEWGELKEIVKTGTLEQLMRNKEMQYKYDVWSKGMKANFGSTEARIEKYLTQARLPFPYTPVNSDSAATAAGGGQAAGEEEMKGTYDFSTSLDRPQVAYSAFSTPGTGESTPGRGSGPNSGATSGAGTPSSVGFVSLSSLNLLEAKLKKSKSKSKYRKSKEEEEEEEEEREGHEPEYLRYDPASGLDESKYAVLPNDWPYCVPYGVRHYCVWSRVPIAHPDLVDYDPIKWNKIEQEGLGGFTGVLPFLPEPRIASNDDADKGKSKGLPTPPTPAPSAISTHFTASSIASALANQTPVGRSSTHPELHVPPAEGWYPLDLTHAGPSLRRWAGVTYESEGGHEVGRMVKGLWDERGWECLWFVNPPRLQSIPGFSHFHVFARRKMPEEIDAGEAVWGRLSEEHNE
ncbi:cytoplasmic protein [Cryptococcus neoformans Bt85]|nr:cytoplasmic protein [Cryptococcus neoformans var. grubii Bt85]